MKSKKLIKNMLHLNSHYKIIVLMKVFKISLYKLTLNLRLLNLFEKYLYFSRNILVFNKHIVH